ncbi:unnamed protein product, partial [Discosporangium mesarthrocarpum]
MSNKGSVALGVGEVGTKESAGWTLAPRGDYQRKGATAAEVTANVPPVGSHVGLDMRPPSLGSMPFGGGMGLLPRRDEGLSLGRDRDLLPERRRAGSHGPPSMAGAHVSAADLLPASAVKAKVKAFRGSKREFLSWATSMRQICNHFNCAP